MGEPRLARIPNLWSSAGVRRTFLIVPSAPRGTGVLFRRTRGDAASVVQSARFGRDNTDMCPCAASTLVALSALALVLAWPMLGFLGWMSLQRAMGDPRR